MHENDVPGPRGISTPVVVTVLQRKIRSVRLTQPVFMKPRFLLSSFILSTTTLWPTRERMFRHRLRAFRVLSVHPRLAEIAQVELIFSHVFKNLFQLSLVIRIRRATSAIALAASPRRNRLRRKVVPRISTKSRMFEQTVAIELEKRARLGEFSLKLCVREAFVLVFPAIKRHSMRERKK